MYIQFLFKYETVVVSGGWEINVPFSIKLDYIGGKVLGGDSVPPVKG